MGDNDNSTNGGTVLLGAGVTMIANSLKDSIPMEDNK